MVQLQTAENDSLIFIVTKSKEKMFKII